MSRDSRLTVAIVAALVAHALALPFVAKEMVFKTPPAHFKSISMVQRSSAGAHPTQAVKNANSPQTASLVPQLPAAKPKELVEQEKPKDEVVPPAKIPGQVVDIGAPKDERAPDKPTKYVSEHDSRVEKESRARETSAFFKNALSKVQKEGQNKKREPQPTQEKKQDEEPQGVASASAPAGGVRLAQASKAELPSRAREDKLHLKAEADGTFRIRDARDALLGNGQRLALAKPGETGDTHENIGPGDSQQVPVGIPSGVNKPLQLTLNRPLDSLMGPVAGGPMPDDLRGVDQGEETLLNSRSFRYAGYLNRVKETVGRIWTSDVQEVSARRDPTGAVHMYTDRRTVVEFTLDRSGEIRDVKVSSSSGVDYLDRVAVDAFKKAERFPNPPAGLLGTEGQITLPFAFTLMAATGGIHVQMGPAYLPGSPAQRGY
ncbi:MAG: TonB family protein [Deltaproteobacteria bacterium]|nr:TonB family protein [Deltaproteobacteria bacterium]